MSHLVRRYRVAFAHGSFSGSFYVWAPNTATANAICRTKRAGGTFEYIYVLGEDPPRTEDHYPVTKPGAYAE